MQQDVLLQLNISWLAVSFGVEVSQAEVMGIHSNLFTLVKKEKAKKNPKEQKKNQAALA